MIIDRVINDVEISIDTSCADVIYFNQNFANKLFGSGINDILYKLYMEKEVYKPLSAMIELTGKCNFNCPFCYVNTCKNANNVNPINFNIIKIDLQSLIDNGLLSCTITGGECFNHPDFVKIYKYLKERGVLVTVLTNLSLLNDEIIEMFKTLPPYKVDVSLYAFDDKNMQEVTLQSKYSANDILNNVLKLKKLGINVKCKTPVNTLTNTQISPLENFCKKHEIPYFYSLEVFENYDGKNMDKYALPKKEIMLDHIKVTHGKYGSELKSFGIKKNFDCKGGQYGVFISHDYKLRPCMPFYSVDKANISIAPGKIKDAILKMDEFIAQYKGDILKGCDGCEASNICQSCIITQLEQPEIKKVKSICADNMQHLNDYLCTI